MKWSYNAVQKKGKALRNMLLGPLSFRSRDCCQNIEADKHAKASIKFLN